MTSQEAFQGIRKIEAMYEGKFIPADIAPIWSRLLELPNAALIHAIGEARIIWRRMPTPREVLQIVESWDKRLDTEKVVEQFDEGKENFALTMGWLEKRITEQQYIQALYEMARKYNRPEYAAQAADREKVLEEEGAADHG
jgi:hypothetical protein